MPAWLRTFSFRTRLSVLAAAAVGIAVALAAVASYIVVGHQLYAQVDHSLTNESHSAVFAGGNGLFNPDVAARFLRRYNSDVLQVVQTDGTVVYPSDGAVLPVSNLDRAIAGGTHKDAMRTVRTPRGDYRVLTVGNTLVASGDQPLALQVGHPITDILHTLATLRLVLLVVTLSGIALAVLIGYVVARTTIRPVVRLTAAAEHVAVTQDLNAAIDDTGDDELARLAHAFNAMLSALAASRQQQAQLISDAGHELRTPLTSLRTNIEVLERVSDLPPEDRVELMADVGAQLEELTTLIGDVVELARQDEQQPDPTEARLDEIVERAVERARRRAPSLQFAVDLTAGAVRAQPTLLERAVLNILDNAAKWSPPGATIDVRLRRGDRWRLEVRDHGPGIDPSDLPRVFDRFYRAPAARSLPGSGLGLAIVAQVVAAHGGTVSASCPPDGGTLIHIELPIVAEVEPEVSQAFLHPVP